jgi:arabinogalactan oligomer / maltooligosaccharide transport system permease protein
MAMTIRNLESKRGKTGSARKAFLAKKSPIFLLFFLIFPFVFWNCSGRDPNKIVVWTSMRPAEQALLQKHLDKFSEKYPDYTIRQLFYSPEELRNNFIISAIGGSGPAIVHGPNNNIGPWVELEVISGLSQDFEPAFLDSFINDPFSANTWFRNDLFQIADRVGNHLCLVYNKDLLPEPPQTMSELIRVGKELMQKGGANGKAVRYAIAWNYTEPFFILPFISGYGGWIMDENFQPTLENEAVIKAGQLILDLIQTHKLMPKECDYEIANALFKDELAAMIINGPWSFATYKENNLNFGVAKIPMIDESALWPAPMVSPRGYSLNKNVTGPQRKVAIELIRYLTGNEVMLDFTRLSGTIPSRIEAYNSELIANDLLIQKSIEQLLVGKLSPVVTELQWVYDAMRPAYQGIFTGAITPQEAAVQMQQSAKKLFLENRQ